MRACLIPIALISALITALFSAGCASNARPGTFGSVSEALEPYEQVRSHNYVELIMAPPRGDVMSNTFGVTYPRKTGDGGGRVFVLSPTVDGRYRVDGMSRAFEIYPDANDGAGFVQTLKVQTKDAFTVLFARKNACGPSIFNYRFAVHRQQWRVVGMDKHQADCDDAGNLVSEYRSYANFMTGDLIRVEYRDNQAVNTTREQHGYPVFPLADFEPFANRYERFEH